MKKSSLGLLGLMAAMMGPVVSEDIEGTGRRIREASPENLKAEREAIDARNERRRRDRYGLKEFRYGDNVVYARNQKNADRKARNKGYLDC